MFNLISAYYTVKEFLIDTSAFTLAGLLKFATDYDALIPKTEASMLSWLGTVSMVIFLVCRCWWIINKVIVSNQEAKINQLDIEIKEEELKKIRKK